MASKKVGARSIWVKRRIRVDKLKRPDPNVVAPVHEVKGCSVLPRWASGAQGNESDKGWIITNGRQVIAPYKSDIRADDIVSLDPMFPPEVTFEVDGIPGDYENKRGKGKATMLYLKALGT